MQLRRRIRSWYQRLFPWKDLGQRGEDAAAKFLKHLGYKIVALRQRDRLGELDIVAADGKTVVFVEVKTRVSQDAGGPEEAVDLEKQKRMTRAALGFLKRHKLLEFSARFDVVAVNWPADQRRPEIEHFPNAFEAVGRWQLFS